MHHVHMAHHVLHIIQTRPPVHSNIVHRIVRAVTHASKHFHLTELVNGVRVTIK